VDEKEEHDVQPKEGWRPGLGKIETVGFGLGRTTIYLPLRPGFKL
jgi:hypothetical protein